MKHTGADILKKVGTRAGKSWLWVAVKCGGALALLWFLVRVIPKPSRASYPCQRAAFPIASGFVIWLCGVLAIKSGWKSFNRGRLSACGGILVAAAAAAWTLVSFMGEGTAQNAPVVKTDWNFVPAPANQAVGVARGIFPGRVVWSRDPQATKWGGQWKQKSDQWWLDENTDQGRVDALLAADVERLTGTTNNAAAWRSIFEYYNQQARGLARGYQAGEVVAVKINLNNSGGPVKTDNYIDASPQSVLAIVRQLVNEGCVRQQDILVYDARRFIPPYMLTKVWSEFKDVRFLQMGGPQPSQPKNPAYGDYSRLEGAHWVEGVEYSNGKYRDARYIPQQVYDATYLVNLALLKAHSYPYNTMEDGDAGQTAVTLTGKNHFGSIRGTPELHSAINTDKEAHEQHVYSPMVDLAASPNLGAKTILYVLDGLYAGRKHRSYPQHFPNPPFNNRVEPYENPEWPASILASLDGVALDSVGLDILQAQTKNNTGADGHPRILIRANADDYLFEEALADHAPSGTVYRQGGKIVGSLGVHEHWDSDTTKRYSRNLDPVNGKGIELVYIPPTGIAAPAAAARASSGAGAPASLPGKGLAQHDFFYAGEAKEERMFIVRNGEIAWSYTHPASGEISDATLLPSGHILFAHQHGVTEITQGKQVVWNYDAPPNTEIHTVQALGDDSVAFIQNGTLPQFMAVNKKTGRMEHQFVLAVGNSNSIHGQFRQMRLTPAGTMLVAHMDQGRAVEYDLDGKVLWSVAVPGIWSAKPLADGNILVASNRKFVREINRQGATVWEWNASEAPDYHFANLQNAVRLPNGNTIINNWFNQWNSRLDTNHPPIQAIEVTPDKQVVWGLSAWMPPSDLGPATTIQLLAD